MAAPLTASAEKAPLDAFIRDPAFSAASLSPDGKYLATVQTVEKDGQPIILLFETADLKKKPKIFGSHPRMKIKSVFWLDNNTIAARFWQRLQIKRLPTVKQFSKLAVMDVRDQKWDDLCRGDGEYDTCGLVSTMPWDDDTIRVSSRNNFYDLNIKSGKKKLVHRGSSKYGYSAFGRDGKPLGRQELEPGTDAVISYIRKDSNSDWVEVNRNEPGMEAVASIFGVAEQDNNNSNKFYVVSNHETDTAAVYEYFLSSKTFGKRLFHNPKYDASGVSTVWRPETDEYEIVGYTYADKAPQVEYISAREKSLMDGIDAALPGANNAVISRTRDESKMIVRSEGPRTPPSYYLLTNKTNMQYLGSSNPDLQSKDLADVTWEYFPTRDGRSMPALITKPNGTAPFPVVMMPHGGPVARDYWGFDLWAQILANEGYMVVQPQFRISSGFGKNHMSAGFQKWGLETQDDVEDALKYVVDKGYAKKDKAAIFGWSYGGYAAFTAAQRSPNVFQCAIPGAGVSEKARFRAFLDKGGDFQSKSYRKTADGYDPLAHVKDVNIPVLVIHGEIDERVPIVHSEKYVSQLKKHKKEHKYVVLEGANHFFGTIFYENYKEMFDEMLTFLEGPCGMKN